MNKKIVLILVLVITFFTGIGCTLLVLYFFPLDLAIAEKTVKEVTVTESDTIKSAIDKVYDAVFMVESYQSGKLVSTGTGFVYKEDDNYGYLITNAHVIEGADSVKVTNIYGDTVDASVLGSDEYSDVAVLSIATDAVLLVAEIGDSTQLALGDTLFTVGSPLGNEYMGTVTKGILSGKDRTVSVTLSNGSFMMEVLQTDAAINPGNSGGPLVNINGEVIGVNSLKLVQDEIEGMGFAIPIEIVMSTVDRLENGEEIIRPMFGVELIDASSSYALYRYQISVDSSIDSGAVIVAVQDNTPASTVGLQKGDVITKVNDTTIKDVAHFRFILYKYSIGDEITVEYNRNGKSYTIKIKLDKSLGS